ncbi:carboxypeptidase A [Tribolium castaneum]|uniref:Carboxypeptidase A n=1 Tax=Tribolium castaneum TaxID=7070 RepID=D6WWL2_TRICA|nr:PREDICTED: mast cell carboxypeptidase A isoform X2 [Tribolium castaneum]EFA09235.1 carboxypeptidase A [Tribolium castaneum]|eukprot:XP_015838227.1 PREDICTED: mast cell carboxypeptidase A isoform X2 [Tribolium castaneum]
MGFFTERCFYTFIIVFLAVFAIVVPILIIQLGKKHPQYVYLFKDLESRHTKSKKLPTSPPDRYYSLSELDEYLNNFVTRRDILFSINAIGETEYFANPIYEVSLAKKGDPKPMVLIVAGIQAKDWTSVYTAINMMHLFFADLRGTTKILEKFNFHFLPLLNPDGYHLATTWPIYSNWINNTSNYDETADVIKSPQGNSVLYDFGQSSGKTEEAKSFKEYFNEHKSHIKAVCFLFSPTNVSFNNSKKYFQFSKEYLDKDEDREKFLEEVASKLSQDSSSFQYVTYLDEPSKNRIDNWISSKSSKPVLVMNFIADFGPRAAEILSKISRTYARQIHAIITKVVTSLQAKFKNF